MTKVNPAAVSGINTETLQTPVTEDAGQITESTSVTLGRTVATRPEGTQALEHAQLLEEIGQAADAKKAQETADPKAAQDVQVESHPTEEAEEVAEATLPPNTPESKEAASKAHTHLCATLPDDPDPGEILALSGMTDDDWAALAAAEEDDWDDWSVSNENVDATQSVAHAQGEVSSGGPLNAGERVTAPVTEGLEAFEGMSQTEVLADVKAKLRTDFRSEFGGSEALDCGEEVRPDTRTFCGRTYDTLSRWWSAKASRYAQTGHPILAAICRTISGFFTPRVMSPHELKYMAVTSLQNLAENLPAVREAFYRSSEVGIRLLADRTALTVHPALLDEINGIGSVEEADAALENLETIYGLSGRAVEHGKSLPTLEAKKDYLVGLKLMSELERYLDNILSAWGKARGNVDSVRSFFEEALPTDDACFDARSRSAENFRNRISSLVRPRETLMENAMRLLQDVPGTAEQKESWSYCAEYLQRTLRGQTVQEGRISEPLSFGQLEEIREAFERANWYEYKLDDRSPEEEEAVRAAQDY